MNISISKEEIFNEVEKRSSLEGYAIPERYDHVWANKQRGALLDSYWVEGCTAIIQLMKRYLSGDTVEHTLSTYDKDEVLTIQADMPARYNTLLDGNVATDIKMILACNILHGWLEVMAPEATAKYDEESKGYSEDLRVKLLYRVEPNSSLSTPKSDDIAIEQHWGKCEIKGECPSCNV